MRLSLFYLAPRPFNVPSSESRIKKGQLIFIPLTSVNRDTKIWGPDATEFKSVTSIARTNILLIIYFGKPRALGRRGANLKLYSRRLQSHADIHRRSQKLHRFPFCARRVSFAQTVLIPGSRLTTAKFNQDESAPVHACARVRV